MADCFKADAFACSRLLGRSDLSDDDHARVEKAAGQLKNLAACERYDLAACHRISTTRLVDLGPGITTEAVEPSTFDTQSKLKFETSLGSDRG